MAKKNKTVSSHVRWTELIERLKKFQEGDSGLYHTARLEMEDAVKYVNDDAKRSDCMDRAEATILKLEKLSRYYKDQPENRMV